MPSSRPSSERSGSIQSQESPKISHSKADPNVALFEAQPMSTINQVSDREMFSLRSIQHRDRNGQIINDPDLSNPTRPRFERPLDTIRSFEAAIDAERRANHV
ncbi:hypothetical protein PENDEC_c031G01736 [Penicillium decumbens]|uniref:Uncharacterized protein n=1 Tax=Penicillium decumbens TaxID=69771 RepID=A0A1V6NVJ0_PENDC|nr:hypothetical protein PENDEC_c031G01736 [Penicillium decumbens]